MPETNPAYRILVVLTRLHQLGLSEHTAIDTAWRDVLQCQEGTLEHTLAKGQLAEAFRDLNESIVKLSGFIDVERYQRYLNRWGRFLFTPPGPGNSVYGASHVASEEELDLLQSLSDLLNARVPEIEPSPEAVADLLEETERLIAVVREADDLDGDLRIFLLGILAKARDALQLVRVRGVRGIDEVLGRVSLDFERDGSVWTRIAQWSGWSALKAFLNGLDNAAAGVDKVSRLERGFSNVMDQIEPPQ